MNIKSVCFNRMIEELLLYGIEMDVNVMMNKIADHVIGTICKFCDRFRFELWLDLIYQDGVDFIALKFLDMKQLYNVLFMLNQLRICFLVSTIDCLAIDCCFEIMYVYVYVYICAKSVAETCICLIHC